MKFANWGCFGCFDGDVDAAVAEIVARGVQPEVLAFPVRELMERGAARASTAGRSALIPVTWSVAGEPLRWLPSVDALAVARWRLRMRGFAGLRPRRVILAVCLLGSGFCG